MKKLSIDFIPIEVLKEAPLEKRVNMIIEKIKDNKIIVINSQFKPQEEAILIRRTMELINKTFTGIEICSLSVDENKGFFNKLKSAVIRLLTGRKSGITVIGPAKAIKDIKREKNMINLLMK